LWPRELNRGVYFMGPELVLLASIVALQPETRAPISREAVSYVKVDKMVEEYYKKQLTKQEREILEKTSLYILPLVERKIVYKMEF
jgi:hypothetical protein